MSKDLSQARLMKDLSKMIREKTIVLRSLDHTVASIENGFKNKDDETVIGEVCDDLSKKFPDLPLESIYRIAMGITVLPADFSTLNLCEESDRKGVKIVGLESDPVSRFRNADMSRTALTMPDNSLVKVGVYHGMPLYTLLTMAGRNVVPFRIDGINEVTGREWKDLCLKVPERLVETLDVREEEEASKEKIGEFAERLRARSATLGGVSGVC